MNTSIIQKQYYDRNRDMIKEKYLKKYYIKSHNMTEEQALEKINENKQNKILKLKKHLDTIPFDILVQYVREKQNSNDEN